MLYVSKDRPFDNTPMAPLDPLVANPKGEHWTVSLMLWIGAVVAIGSLVLLCVAAGA